MKMHAESPKLHPPKGWPIALALLCLGGACTGGDETPKSADLPPPGQMRIVSVTPLNSGTQDGIANGGYETWYAGAPWPEGWTMPTAGAVISREVEHVASGQFACRETWLSSDKDAWIFKCFGKVQENLLPRSRYRLSVSARAEDGAHAYVSVWELTGKDQQKNISGKLISVEPSAEFVRYTGEFTTRESGTIMIVCRTDNKPEELPKSVVWDDWQLTLLGPAAPGKPAAPPAPVEAPDPVDAAAPPAAG
jgi:hypothetical protein